MTKKTKRRLYAKIDKEGSLPEAYCVELYPEIEGLCCYLWTACCDKDGYGKFWYKGNNRKASNVMYILRHGQIPKGLFVLHKCDNTSCVRDEHLFLGDSETNAHDRDAKDRQSKGEYHPASKLTVVKAKKIRKLYASGNYTTRELGVKFGVAATQISKIIRGIRWKIAA